MVTQLIPYVKSAYYRSCSVTCSAALQIALMHVYVTQANFTTKPRFEIKNKRSFTEMNSQGKRIPTHKKCKCKKFCSQTRLVGEIYSSDVIMHRGYCLD